MDVRSQYKSDLSVRREADSERYGLTMKVFELVDLAEHHMLGMYSKVGRRAPLQCTAIGKVLLVWGHPERRAMILQGAVFTKYRDKTIVEPAAFAQELERLKAQGFGEDRE